MIYVSNNVINLTVGDDAVLTVPLKDAEAHPYTMDPREYLIFALKETPTDESPVLLEINSESGSNQINFTHNDTKDLDVGFYSAEVQLMTVDGQRVTVWPKLEGNNRTSKSNRRNFCLMTEVVTR